MEYNKQYTIEKSFWYVNSSEEKEQLKGKTFVIVGELPSYYMCKIADEELPTLLSKTKIDDMFPTDDDREEIKDLNELRTVYFKCDIIP